MTPTARTYQLQAATHAHAALLEANALMARPHQKPTPVATEPNDPMDPSVSPATACLTVNMTEHHSGPVSPSADGHDETKVPKATGHEELTAGLSDAHAGPAGSAWSMWSSVHRHAHAALAAWESAAWGASGQATANICGLPPTLFLMADLAHMLGLQGATGCWQGSAVITSGVQCCCHRFPLLVQMLLFQSIAS